jgi:hypothetical protein
MRLTGLSLLLGAKPMLQRISIFVPSLLLALVFAGNAQQPDLVAHEWGTFTSIAGNSGTPVQWFPWAVPSDLPQFVEHFQPGNFKPNLSGTIRMETPVLYFYSSQAQRVSVHVRFSKGLITEWYPRATHVTPTNQVQRISLKEREADGSITWDSVAIRPGDATPLLKEDTPSSYYAARATASAPLQVATRKGPQDEKFLFYRGVSSADGPISASVRRGGSVEIENRSGEPIAELLIFDRHGDAVGFRSLTNVDQSTTLSPPEPEGSVAEVSELILGALMDQGLYPDEARAMLETWKDSWFEEGTRLLYIVPRSFVDGILPLTIAPAPTQTTRVFVGRMELVSPRTQATVETALATHDEATLAKYNRFLQPILEILQEREHDPAKLIQIRARLEHPYVSLVAQAESH